MTSEIKSLSIDDVLPDPDQPRRYFDREALDRLKAAIFSVGQLNPIRVRRVDDRWMIVDGQRRWLAITALRKQYPDDSRFASIQSYVGGDLDEEVSSRRVVQVLSNVSADLTPSEKADVLHELLHGEPKLSIDEAAQRLGLAKGQALFLRQLAGAPAFIRDLGRGADGAALPLWNLVTLVRLHRKLRKWDDDSSGRARDSIIGLLIGKFDCSAIARAIRASENGSSRPRRRGRSPVSVARARSGRSGIRSPGFGRASLMSRSSATSNERR
jgi:ParB/RepB/Spo0J family partition protein